MNQTARALLERIESDMESLAREQAARNKVAPLIERIRDAYYRFRGTRLHVSPEISLQLRCSFAKCTIGELRFLGCPVTTISDLDGFRWVRERENAWECGPVIRVDTQIPPPVSGKGVIP